MSRPTKEGLEYFPLVTKYEDKVELIVAEFGAAGLGILTSIWQKIYANGYYAPWDSDVLMLFARQVNEELTRVNTVINRCFDRDILNKNLYEKYGILTSRGIQKQYLKICKECRRKNIVMIQEYCLLNNNPELTSIITVFTRINAEETPLNDSDNRQSKVKKSKEKVKESKVQKDTPPLCEKYAENEKVDTQGSNASSTKHTQESNASSKTHTVKVQCAEFVSMTNAEHNRLVSTYGAADTARMVEKLDNYKGGTGKRYKSDYRAILSWVADEVLKNKREAQPGKQKSSLGLLQELYDEEVAASGAVRDNQTVCDI